MIYLKVRGMNVNCSIVEKEKHFRNPKMAEGLGEVLRLSRIDLANR